MSKEYQLVHKVAGYNSESDKSLIIKAIEFSKKAHNIQLRASGDPYFIHPLAVADILADLKLDDASIVTALLHDTVEDTVVTIKTIEQEFGKQVAKLVEGVTKLNKIDYQPENVRQAENFRKLLLAMSEDIRILLVKIADRLHNMRTISHISSKIKRSKIAQETIEIYVPLTERIGMHRLKDELEDLSFSEINAEVRGSIIQRLEFLKDQGDKNIVGKIVGDLRVLLASKKVECRIQGREKKPYSIWQKMKRKNISFEQLSDIMAFRIILNDIKECYHALGIIHSKYHSIPGSFKDYISTPKSNGYRSLHTTVIGPGEQKIEIQIRTFDMHEIAEYGIAAHWCYKEGVDINKVEDNYKWINELLNVLEFSSDPEEFIRNTRLEMHQDQVFCFSPKGNLIALPYGATAVDFAYAIHSEVGNTCIGVKVNGVITPLRSVLSNGDQVEVICSVNQHPSETWEEFVVTGKAQAQIRKYVRSKKRETFLKEGRHIIQRFFVDKKVEFSDVIIKSILHIFSKKNIEDLFIAVGEGLIVKQDVLNACYPDYEENKNNGVAKSKILTLFVGRKGKKSKKSKIYDAEHSIKGLIPGMSVDFAECCCPLPGDKVLGVVHIEKGITVHLSKCSNIKKEEMKDSIIKLYWNSNTEIRKLYLGKLRIIAANNFGTISMVISEIASQNINIVNMEILHKTEAYYELIIDLELDNVKKLRALKAYLRTVKIVYSVNRI